MLKGQIYCESCGEMFEASELDSIHEYHGEDYEEFPCCPMCGGTELSSAEECEMCHMPMPPFESRGKNRVFDCCDDCASDLMDELAELLEAHYGHGEQSVVADILTNNMDEIEKRMDAIRAKKKKERRAS